MFGFLRAAPAVPATLSLAGRDIPLDIVRSPRARRILLRADAVQGRVRLTLPARAKLGGGIEFLHEHDGWLSARVACWPSPLPFVPGAVIPFDGAVLTLVHAPQRSRGVVREGSTLQVGGEAATLPGRVARWLKAAALADLDTATRALAARIERPVAAVSVRDPAARWGSCAQGGRVAYSWRLILAPPAVRASVVAHEVAHLVHPNHGAAFWALARDIGGDPAPHRRWLAAHGAALHWVGRS